VIYVRLAFCFLLGLLVSCRVEQNRAPAIGEVFAGPTTLTLRQELAPKSATVATAKHGDRLEVLEYKRRFVRVRTPEGREGWTDARLLLTPDQMADLRQMADRTAQLPSQGAASTFESLNMHTEPSRTSPSFVQIPENGKVDVIGHKLTPRIQPAAASQVPVKVVKPRIVHRRSKDRQSSSKVPPPPPPSAPAPPHNWQALSVPNTKSLEQPQQADSSKPTQAPPPPAPVHMDDWSLVRTKDGKAGWVLTRMLSMSIPDEVAQYAEGHRITSYFSLGQVHDGDQVKNNWLWTTIVKGLEPYEFDSFRIFVWSRNHHRYETAYIDRNIIGHFPVQVDTSGAAPRFSLLVEGVDGQLYKKTYMMDGNRVRLVDRVVAQPAQTEEAPKTLASIPQQSSQQPSKDESWFSRMKHGVTKLFR
jgi:hypothetical protein